MEFLPVLAVRLLARRRAHPDAIGPRRYPACFPLQQGAHHAMHRSFLTTAALLVFPAFAPAQLVTVRDTIVALPPISFCQDGATHVTVCTGLRLRPRGVPDLSPFVGQAIEITGRSGMITCSFVDVSSVTVLPSSQFSSTSTGTGTMSVSFSGAAPAGTVYLLFLSGGLANPPTMQPPIMGTIHLPVAQAVFSGVFVPMGTGMPYHTITVPLNPSLQGIPFYDQVAAVNSNGTIDTTNVDCFMF